MEERDRSSARPERTPVWRAIGAWGTAVLLVAALLSGCGSQPSPSPTQTPAATPVATATPAPTPTYADTLRVGTPGGPARDSWGGWPLGMLFLGTAVYGYLYQFDAHFGVVPDLADGPCFVPGADGKVIRCRIIETTFHDGTPLTADDVAYSFRLFATDPFENPPLREVRVVDPRTVDFVLSSVDATFLTGGLPAVPIVPQHAVEASYAEFLTRTENLTAKGLAKLADTIDADVNRSPPVCSPHVDAVAALFDKLGVAYYREDYFADATGTFDPCWYAGSASGYIRAAADALGKTGLDAVAAAYPVLSINWQPISTGPYRFVSEDATRIHLEAWPGYHGGLAATRYLDFVHTKDDGSDLLDGTVDIFPQWAPHDVAFQAAAASHGVRFATVLSTGSYYALAFNVRPGRLFADLALRQALQLCIDLPRAVDAATAGNGTPVYGPVLPDSWAYDPDLPKPDRDVAAAKRLIEGAGWQLGADKIYAKDGVRLAAPILTRAVSERVKMADLIALQARDCGMDLASLPLGEDVWIPALQYPHYLPGTHTPWDLFIFGLGAITDPGNLMLVTSSHITSAKNPADFNFSGFSDPVVDRLDAAGISTYDQAERATLMRQEQEEIAAQVPYLYLWTDTTYDAVRVAVTTVDGPLDLTVPNWRVQLSRMVVAASNP